MPDRWDRRFDAWTKATFARRTVINLAGMAAAVAIVARWVLDNDHMRDPGASLAAIVSSAVFAYCAYRFLRDVRRRRRA